LTGLGNQCRERYKSFFGHGVAHRITVCPRLRNLLTRSRLDMKCSVVRPFRPRSVISSSRGPSVRLIACCSPSIHADAFRDVPHAGEGRADIRAEGQYFTQEMLGPCARLTM
jgi:hypothetical protein